VERAAKASLPVRELEAETRQARGAYLRSRADLLPRLDGVLSQRRQDRSQAAFSLPDHADLSFVDPIVTDIAFPGVPTDIIRFLRLPEQSVSTVADPIPLNIQFEDSTGPRDYGNAQLVLSAPLFNLPNYREMKSARSNTRRTELATEARAQEVQAETARLYARIQWLEMSAAVLREVLALRESQETMAVDLQESQVVTALDLQEQRLRVLQAKQNLAEALTQVARLARDASVADRYPEVRAVGTYGQEGETFDDTVEAWTLGVVARITLWDFHGRKGSLDLREGFLQRVEYEVLDLEQQIMAEVAKAPLDVNPNGPPARSRTATSGKPGPDGNFKVAHNWIQEDAAQQARRPFNPREAGGVGQENP